MYCLNSLPHIDRVDLDNLVCKQQQQWVQKHEAWLDPHVGHATMYGNRLGPINPTFTKINPAHGTKLDHNILAMC